MLKEETRNKDGNWLPQKLKEETDKEELFIRYKNGLIKSDDIKRFDKNVFDDFVERQSCLQEEESKFLKWLADKETFIPLKIGNFAKAILNSDDDNFKAKMAFDRSNMQNKRAVEDEDEDEDYEYENNEYTSAGVIDHDLEDSK